MNDNQTATNERRLKEIRERCLQADARPWIVTKDGDHINVRPVGDYAICECFYQRSYNPDANADFIACAREDIPWLCDLVEQLLKVIEKDISKMDRIKGERDHIQTEIKRLRGI